jgi:nucleoside-diphosphate-sugar epimerase
LEINSRAQLSILEMCRKYNPTVKIVFASTRQIYGKPDYLPVDEKHPVRPMDVNGINKLAGEWYHILYNNVYGIRTCALRLTNTYGPGMRIKDARQTFLGIWIKLLIEDKPFEIWEGQQLRDFNYVDDAVDAFLVAAECEKADGQIFNLGGDEPISLHNLGNMLVNINGKGEFITKKFPAERKRIDIGDYYSDYSKIKKELGWTPKILLREGLTHTIEYYQKYHQQYR